MHKLLFTTSLLMGLSSLYSQEKGRMETDRPDQTESPVLTKKKFIQAEWGFSIEKENGFPFYVHPTVLWKYGASKRFEFRFITELVSVETHLINSGGKQTHSGLLPIQIGGKISFWEEKGLLPKTSLIFHVAPSKLGSKKFHTDKWSPNFRFTMQNTISENVGLGYNLGAEWDGISNTPYWIYTFAPGINMGKNFYGYLELFGAVRKNEAPQHSFDAGLAYYFHDNFKLDISSGFGLTEAATDWYGAIGFSFRLNTKN